VVRWLSTVAQVGGTATPDAVQLTKALPAQRYAFHGEWNYVIHPGLIPGT
jgi:hypothetical protein